MNRTLEIQRHLLDNAAEITRLERALVERPSRALNSSLKSLYKLRQGLEIEFQDMAAVSQVDVIEYRIFEGKQPTMALVGRAMESFQTLYTILYNAVISERPKDTAHLSAEAIQESSFEFAYAFSGSVGFVFTIPNDRLLLGETHLDEAMADLFAIAKCSTTDEVKSFAKKFGLAPIRAVYQWASALCASGAGAELQWKKNESTKGDLVLKPSQLQALKDLISLTSDLEVDSNTFTGLLLGYDSEARMFRFDPDDGGSTIRGKVDDGAEIPPTVVIPKRYIAEVKTSTTFKYATEQPEVSHILLRLEKPKLHAIK